VAKILLVEDEPDLAQIVATSLQRAQHFVKVIQHGDQAVAEIRVAKDNYELLIMDLMLPGRDGFEICRFYRYNMGTAPILVVTARQSIQDKEKAFSAGADDYLTKPFQLKELHLRVSSLLRRSGVADILEIRDIKLNMSDCSVTKAGSPIHLSPRELQLLGFLLKNPNQVFSPDELLRLVWGSRQRAMNDTVRGHVKRLRQKLDSQGQPSIISNVYGIGYKLQK
jgi:DNA-binding response OmpR family regulator